MTIFQRYKKAFPYILGWLLGGVIASVFGGELSGIWNTFMAVILFLPAVKHYWELV